MEDSQISREVAFYNEEWLNNDWSEMIENSPAPKHRRRIIKEIIKGSPFKINSILDVGCGSGILIKEMKETMASGIRFSGCDISESVLNINKKKYSDIDFFAYDLDGDSLNREADVITCSEVLEHVRNWEQSLDKLIKAAKKRVVVTVPSGKLFEIDRKVGHYRHFNRKMIEKALTKHSNIKYSIFFWGMPFHSLYKQVINLFPKRTYASFAQKKYSGRQEFISRILYFIFFLNVTTKFETNQMFIVIDRDEMS